MRCCAALPTQHVAFCFDSEHPSIGKHIVCSSSLLRLTVSLGDICLGLYDSLSALVYFAIV